MPHALFYLLADDVEGAFQTVRICHSGDEYLFDVRFGGPCVLAQAGGVGGHIAQVHQGKSFAFYFFNHNAQDAGLLFFVFGQKYESGSVFSFFGYGYALQEDEFVGNL